MRLRFIPLLCCFAACGPAINIRPEDLRPAPPVAVAMSVPQPTAFQRTVAAFAAEGLTVVQAEQTGGVIVSQPITDAPTTTGGPLGLYSVTAVLHTTYRANVIAEGDSSRVLLTMSLRSQYVGGSSGSEPGEDYPATVGCADHERCAKNFRRLDAIAARLR